MNNNTTNTPRDTHSPENTPKHLTLKIVGILLVLAIGASVARTMRNRAVITPVPLDISEQTAQERCKEGDTFSAIDGKPCGPVADVNSYDGAVKEYAGKLVLLEESCTAAPARVSIGAPTRVLVANHSAQAVTVSLNGKQATLSPYHYMTTGITSGTNPVLCNGSEVARFVVEK